MGLPRGSRNCVKKKPNAPAMTTCSNPEEASPKLTRHQLSSRPSAVTENEAMTATQGETALWRSWTPAGQAPPTRRADSSTKYGGEPRGGWRRTIPLQFVHGAEVVALEQLDRV